MRRIYTHNSLGISEKLVQVQGQKRDLSEEFFSRLNRKPGVNNEMSSITYPESTTDRT